MTHVTKADLGPLVWVKSEIDLALARASEALTEAGKNDTDSKTQIQFAQTHLHQARGALLIVGLDGVVQCISALDQLLNALSRGEIPSSPAMLSLGRRALASFSNYLEELVHDTPDQPLRLLSIYTELKTACGDSAPSPSELFFPDLSQRPPRRTKPVQALKDIALAMEIRALRTLFERGLLDWLRTPQSSSGPKTMQNAVTGIEALQDNARTRALWWASIAFFDALIDGTLSIDIPTKRLCSQLDIQMRRLTHGNTTPPESLMRDLLYCIACTPTRTKLQKAVHKTWQLDALLPEPGARVSDIPLVPLLETLRKQLSAINETWDKLSSGATPLRSKFEVSLAKLAPQAQQLGRPALDRLLAGIHQFSQWLRDNTAALSEEVALEIATALLLAETGLGHSAPDSNYSAQVKHTLDRLAKITAGEPLPTEAASSEPTTPRRTEEREALDQVSKEILLSLAHVEQILDDYFRDQEKQAPLNQLSAPMQQIKGALAVLGEDEAISLASKAEKKIAQFAKAKKTPSVSEFEHLAEQLSALGFYVASLQYGTGDPSLLKPGASIKAIVASDETCTDEAITVETPHEITSSAPEIEDIPSAQSDTIDIPPFDEKADDKVIETPPASTTSVTTEPAQIDDEDVDAELLEIFIEEAHEVLATVKEHLGHARSAPGDPNDLISIRRSFHTLKGSGRMVGLREFGEAAWSIEQTLNRWLQLELTPTEALYQLIEHAHDFFAEWVIQLERGGPHGRDASALAAEAENLRSEDTAALDYPIEIPAAPQPTDPEAPESSSSESDEKTATRFDHSEDVEEISLADIDPPEEEIISLSAIDEPSIAEDITDTQPASTSNEETKETLHLDDETITSDEFIESAGSCIVSTTSTLADLESSIFSDPSVSEKDTLRLQPKETDTETTVTESSAPKPEEIPFKLAPSSLEPDIFFADSGETGHAPLSIEAEELAEMAEEASDEPAKSEEPESVPSSADLSRAKEPLIEAVVEEFIEEEENLGDSIFIGDIELSRPLYDLFLAEAKHHISTLRSDLATLQSDPELFSPESSTRAAHTLAGISGTARIESLLSLARALEHAQQRLIRPPSADELTLFATVIDTLAAMIRDVEHLQIPAPTPDLIEGLKEVGIGAAPAKTGSSPSIPITPQAQPIQKTPPSAAAPSFPATSATSAATETALEAARAVADEIDQQLLPIFLEEAAELLDELQSLLRTWKKQPDNVECNQTAARLLHTIKGSARMTGAMGLGEYIHQVESRLKATAGITSAFIDELISSIDLAELMLDNLALGEKTIIPPSPREIAETIPQTDTTTTTVDDAAELESFTSPTIRVRADLIDRFVNEAGEIGIARTRIDGELRTLRRSLLDLTENVIRLRNQLREVEIQADTQMQSRIAQAESLHGEFDPLEMDRYTRLQELTRMMAESVNDVTTVQQNLLKNLDGADLALLSQARLSRELQQALMQVRMAPFDSLANRLYRVIRQSAKDLGKRANLDLRGGTIEVDRSVLEHMVAPLEHLLRNAVAHGIESPEERRASGKPETGQITITVAQEGNEIAVSLVDDGRGLNFEKIIEKGRKNGLIGPNETPDRRRLTNIIFMPGFTTSQNVSAVSGRGVGMDVVKTETAAVGGRIDVNSEPGTGTSFHIYLPLTLAATQALLVYAGNQTYAIPSSMVVQVMELKPDVLETIRSKNGTNWLGEHYPYGYLPHLLGFQTALPEAQRYNWILLLRSGAQTLALHVDSLRGSQEIVVKKAGPQLSRIIGMSGATVMGDGEIVLILNPVALADRKFDDFVEPTEETIVEQQPERQPIIMVVDDSLTVRKVTGRLLEREGYRVITAKDGIDGLEKLIETTPDVILSDIEMPRMDGFDFVRNVRADSRTANIPIIMITSRLADKHRKYAEEIGANHYLGKPYQEEELLRILAGYTSPDHQLH